MDQLTIGVITNEQDLQKAWSLIEKENWFNFNHDQWRIANSLDNCHVIAAQLNNHEVIGTVMCCVQLNVPYVYAAAFVTHEKYRKMGIGSKVWQCMVDTFCKDRFMALNSGGAQTIKYRSQSLPFSGLATRRLHIKHDHLLEAINKKIKASHNDQNIIVESFANLKKDTLEKVIEYDKKVSQTDRSEAIKALVNETSFECSVGMDTDTGTVVGYVMLATTMDGDARRIGPLYANNSDQALALIAHVITHHNQLGIQQYLVRFFQGNTKVEDMLSGIQVQVEEELLDSCYEQAYTDTFDKDKVWFTSGNIYTNDC